MDTIITNTAFSNKIAERSTVMNFTFAHNNLNVFDLDRSLSFYKEALGLTETRRKDAEDGSFTLVYLGDGATPHRLSASRIRQWEFISSKILTDTGWRSYLRNNPYTIQVCDQISTISKSKTAASRISRSGKRLSLLYFANSSVL